MSPRENSEVAKGRSPPKRWRKKRRCRSNSPVGEIDRRGLGPSWAQESPDGHIRTVLHVEGRSPTLCRPGVGLDPEATMDQCKHKRPRVKRGAPRKRSHRFQIFRCGAEGAAEDSSGMSLHRGGWRVTAIAPVTAGATLWAQKNARPGTTPSGTSLPAPHPSLKRWRKKDGSSRATYSVVISPGRARLASFNTLGLMDRWPSAS